ncbi:type II toxin-antitoxin system RelE/ParE family toxin [Alsobacter sp. KACC 23698]|uniref:Type II toxin-antitoxin system RelE/ParE family toxin n=1 Tax=Alsobacter sp. KACC 23698 TaxID=3149229 RepID=A0AAU7J9E8_9HYPH
MIWRVVFDAAAAKELRVLGHAERLKVEKYLRDRIATAEDPRRFGKPLSGDLAGLWRYRVGDVRIIASIQNNEWIVLVLRVGHRSRVYD